MYIWHEYFDIHKNKLLQSRNFLLHPNRRKTVSDFI